MKFRALLFGVGLIFSLMPTAALATTTPIAQKPYCTLYASSGVVELGRTTNLSWSSQYATQGFITSIGTVGINGVQGVIPTAPATTYVGTFTGPGGTGNCSVTVSIIQPSGSVGGGGGDTVPEPDKLPPANEITLDKTPGKGLISCGDTTGLTPGTAAYYAAATNCQACHLASLAQKIINFLLGLSIPLAAVMFAYAGVIYFSSGVEMSINKIEKAHAIFRSVGIGFMIVLGAWLGVQTVLKTILADEYYRGWNTIQCVKPESRPMNKDIGKDLLSVLPGLNTNTLAPVSSSFNDRVGVLSSGLSPSCGNGYELSYDMGGNQTCWNASSDSYQTPTYNNPYTGFNGDIAAAALNYYGTDTTSGPDDGNKACVWSVNNILKNEGIAPIDGNLVYNMEQELNSGRGTPVSTSNAQPGDIVVWKNQTVSHVGIVTSFDSNNQPIVTSNTGTRGNASFTGTSGTTFRGVPGNVYRVNR